jgi:hypothetical protein
MLSPSRTGLAVALLAACHLLSPLPCTAQAPKDDAAARKQAELRRTVEKKRERRARAASRRQPNAIVPWPMPPALIIRATPDVHDEVDSLLWLLRRGP